jgi:hypothetical protein
MQQSYPLGVEYPQAYLDGTDLARAENYLPVQGKVCIKDSIPDCYFCDVDGVQNPGPFDFATRMGPWANGCEKHYRQFRATSSLGVGMAQLWIQRP